MLEGNQVDTMFLTLALFSILICSSLAQDPDLSDRFNSYFRLNESPLFELYWSVNITGNRIACAVRARTNGWVGFGISPDGRMLDSDVIMAFVDDNTGVVNFTVSGHSTLKSSYTYTRNACIRSPVASINSNRRRYCLSLYATVSTCVMT